MEEQKQIDPPENLGQLYIAQWQWQCDLDPWEETDPAKWSWENYSEETCIIIERAFSLKQGVADLGEYEVDLIEMRQINKKDRYRQRRVRRKGYSRFMIEMPEPKVVPRDDKTINHAFGTVQHFLNYIMKRTPEAHILYKRLMKLNLDCGEAEFHDIVQEVIACVKKGAEARAKNIKLEKGNSPVFDAELIVEMIKEKDNLKSLRDFLKAILRIYTMESFLCYWLNELLRSENWKEMNVLTPYLVCLVYSFKVPAYIIKYEEPKGLMSSLMGYAFTPTITFYRGATLTKEQLEIYDPKKLKMFSWNGVTSTSRSRTVAFDFIKISLKKSQEANEPKFQVLFTIETDFASIKDCEGMIDTIEHDVATYKEEKEVILAPGTVFELRQTRWIENNNVREVTLKIRRNFEGVEENIELLGALQEQVISPEKGFIDSLPPSEIEKALKLLKGNQLIPKLEIRNSEIDENLMETIENTRISTKINKDGVKLHWNTISVESLSVLAHYYSPEGLSDILMRNKVVFLEESVNSALDKDDSEDKKITKKKDKEMKRLILREGALEKYQSNDDQLKELWKQIKREAQITNVTISMQKIRLSDEELNGLFECVQSLKALEEFTMIFDAKIMNPNEISDHLERTRDSIASLKRISLGFKISNEGMDLLNSEIFSRLSLWSLSLDFAWCNQISDEKLGQLRLILECQPSLNQLSLNFEGCGQLSDKGLYHLGNGIAFLKELQHLSLNFTNCYNVSDEGLRYLKDGLSSSDLLLKDLSLNFGSCEKITDVGLEDLKEVIKLLKLLTSLSLDFTRCNKISDQGLECLKNSIIPLRSLEFLSLSFALCKMISDEGLNYLKTALVGLNSLQHISLDFGLCNKVSDGGLGYLKDALKNLVSLKHVSLNFEVCNQISDEGLDHLRSAIEPLKCLEYISFQFALAKKISKEGLRHFKSAFISLKSLQNLTLNFRDCKGISNRGLNNMKNELAPMIKFIDFKK